jgi:predicted phosphoribosyltransferase
MGAIASGGVRVRNDEVVWTLQIPNEVIDQVAADEEREPSFTPIFVLRSGAHPAARHLAGS